MIKKFNAPRLRFPGFTDEWEQRKLSEVVTINPKTELPDEFKYVDLESVVGTNLLGFQVIKKENAPSRAQRLASYGDVFYQTVRPYQRNNYLFENIDKDMVFSTGYAQLRSKLDSYFLLTLVQNDNFVKVVLDNCTGTSYPAINGSELGKITVQIPSNDAEANQIGKVFRGIDNIITLHQRKLNHLILKKKSLLQKLFPKNGGRYPELRFPGFTDAWEQRKFKDLFIERREKTIRENEETLLSCAITGIYLNSELFSHFRGSSTIGYLKIKKYDLILSAQNLHLGNANINLSFEKGMISPAYKVFELKNIDPYFINAWVKKDSTKNFFLKATTEGASQCRKNIEWDVLLNQEIPVPNNLEQRVIGKFINNIDMIITLHQRKLNHLKLQKKALLQQLFV